MFSCEGFCNNVVDRRKRQIGARREQNNAEWRYFVEMSRA